MVGFLKIQQETFWWKIVSEDKQINKKNNKLEQQEQIEKS